MTKSQHSESCPGLACFQMEGEPEEEPDSRSPKADYDLPLNRPIRSSQFGVTLKR
ncbi:hypothetical protein H5P27_04510 [Pelagicoccus albus]|uniref:Uncharacterized protein n=1 Tax=Pelagicoccus albus TaxID=415222 RepID=A0A7X1E7K8_9BACT|nr:hypothetical protein [Pelagicoccus albus]MBC2605301.1 hypothetical protein [Pelagicoccus albus]